MATAKSLRATRGIIDPPSAGKRIIPDPRSFNDQIADAANFVEDADIEFEDDPGDGGSDI